MYNCVQVPDTALSANQLTKASGGLAIPLASIAILTDNCLSCISCVACSGCVNNVVSHCFCVVVDFLYQSVPSYLSCVSSGDHCSNACSARNSIASC